MSQSSNSSRVGFFLYSPNDKKVLIHKRDDGTENSPNQWDYFGGKIEPIDQGRAEEALARELYEELGISVDKDSVKLLAENSNMYYILFPKYKTRELRLGEGAGFTWFSFEEALGLDKNLITDEAKKYLEILRGKVF